MTSHNPYYICINRKNSFLLFIFNLFIYLHLLFLQLLAFDFEEKKSVQFSVNLWILLDLESSQASRKMPFNWQRGDIGPFPGKEALLLLFVISRGSL